MGKSGQGAHTKMVAQICLANNLNGFIEAMIYMKKIGMDINQVYEILKNSGANSYAMTVYMPRIINGDL